MDLFLLKIMDVVFRLVFIKKEGVQHLKSND
jgi:hypothetical protein